MKTKQIVLLLLRLTVAVIFLQTLYFKFTAHPDSVYIFTALGAEPYGRIGLGLLELFTAILILLPRTQLFGMLASLVIILGAVASHIVVIGIAIKNDGGGLFILALIVLIATSIFLYLQKNELIKTYQHYLP
ncbi:MAG TPA: DoxX family protein [Bacteroidia bacterium]|nr:DoxX family protein [Bacteroidia bacterium]HRH09454.1 DoxX family protein [Bacteroidia bacterium]HRH63736.1 DoxX family protein [Bacteroidia bacterium]